MSRDVDADAQAFHQAKAELDDLAESVAAAEIFGGVACAPEMVYLAQVGMGAAIRGCSAEGWRAEVSRIRGRKAQQELERAEGCMRESGLWLWK